MNTKDDVEMKDANADVKQITEKIENVKLQAKNSVVYSGTYPNNNLSEYKKTIQQIEKSLSIKDSKSLIQYFRYINRFRRGFNEDDISFLCDVYLRNKFHFKCISPCEAKIKKGLYEKFGIAQNSKLENLIKDVPEFYLFNALIVLTTLVDKKQYQNCLEVLHFLLDYLRQNETTTIQYLKSRVYFYFALVSEKVGKFDEVINEFYTAYRKACLDLDLITQNTLINCIVRYLLENNSYEQARNFLSKTKFHENILTNEDARYLYYLGRINAVQLNYSEAYKNLTDSSRKSPEKSAKGFKTIIQKLLIIIEMLMGDVPDVKKYIGNLKEMNAYCNLIKAVSQGSLDYFNQVLNENKKLFLADKNYNLIQKLRYVVIKVGLRKINLSYTRISLADMSQKLHLESQLETEYIVGKAIQEGVFLGKIDKDKGHVESLEIKDLYSTFEPQKAIQRRILFLNKIYNDSMKGLKYPDQMTHKPEMEKDLDENDMGGEDMMTLD